MFRRSIFLAVLALAACSGVPRVTYIEDLPDSAVLQTVYVASNREFADANFTPGRADELGFTRFQISIPPNREVGEVSWTNPRFANPQDDFMVAEASGFENAASFRSEISSQLAALPPEDREVVVFVHGFNNNFASGLIRAAQMAHDFDPPGIVTHFSWPSAGNPVGYAYDRDSVMISRDALQDYLETLRAAGADRILLVAHSVGSHLVMEALRQIRISGDADLLNRLTGVALISPDIDVEVFQSQARALAPLPQPFFIFTSQRDRVLRISARLTGQSSRLGTIDSPDDIAEFEITLVDLSEFRGGSGDWGHHMTLVSSPSLIRLFGGLSGLADGQSDVPVGLLPGTVLTVRNATQILLSPVTQ